MEDSSSDPSSHVTNATRVFVILALEGRETGIIGLLGYQLSSRFSKRPCLKKIWLSVINQGTGVSTLASAYRHAGIFTYVHTHIRAQIHTPLPLPLIPLPSSSINLTTPNASAEKSYWIWCCFTQNNILNIHLYYIMYSNSFFKTEYHSTAYFMFILVIHLIFGSFGYFHKHRYTHISLRLGFQLSRVFN